MDSIVLDASVVLAVLQQERGNDRVLAAVDNLGDAIAISSVSLCEVITKLVREGADRTEAHLSVSPCIRYVVDFTSAQAQRAGELATVWTTDRAWKKLKIGVQVELVRGSTEV